MPKRDADRKWLRTFSDLVAAELADSLDAPGLLLFPKSRRRQGIGETDGWWVELGKLRALPSVTAELWLDRYADGARRRLWYGFGSYWRKPIERVATSAEDLMGAHQRVGDDDLADDSKYVHLERPLRQPNFDTPILSLHDVFGYGFYEWHVPPFSRVLARDRADHIAGFFRDVALRIKNAGTPAVRPSASPAPLIDVALEKAAGHSGQGRQADPKVRRAIEMRAMRVVTMRYEAMGYDVQDVSRAQSYDLRCTKGRMTRLVEVKGTTGVARSVLVTTNEVRLAEDRTLTVDLAVVHSIHVAVSSSGKPRATGGELRLIQPWTVSRRRLQPIAYSYSLSD